MSVRGVLYVLSASSNWRVFETPDVPRISHCSRNSRALGKGISQIGCHQSKSAKDLNTAIKLGTLVTTGKKRKKERRYYLSSKEAAAE